MRLLPSKLKIEFNQQVAEDNSKYISKLKDLIS